MARITGDKNYSVREKRLAAEIAAQKAKVEAMKAELKVRDARLKEIEARKRKAKT